jgi:molecular chaperone Hsp33
MLVSLGEQEALAAAAGGTAQVRCEFCGQRYTFGVEQIRELLEAAVAEVRAPERLQ